MARVLLTRGCIIVVVAAMAVAGAGCEALPSKPPESLTQLRLQQAFRDQTFTHEVIALHNLRRVLSKELSVAERLESLRVVEEMDAAAVDTCPAMAQALAEAELPAPVRKAVVTFLAARKYAGLGPYMAEALRQAKDDKQREIIFRWIQEHPSAEVLTEIVRLWASNPPTKTDQELRYRQTVHRITGKRWDQALLDALNSGDFFARGSAVEILAARVTPDSRLRQRILTLEPRTEAVRAMQAFAGKLAYVPKTRRELLATVTIYKRHGGRLTQVAALAEKWRREHEYRFNIRDFHLLGALASDPLRNANMSRAHLALEVSRAIAGRRGQLAGGFPILGPNRKSVFRRRRLVDFNAQVESLNLADLWNLLLIDQMLSRPRVHRMLEVTAQRDRIDRQTQYGGLISYELGQAEAKQYHPAEKRGDDQYVASKWMLSDSTDAMAYFLGHFNKPSADPASAGPTDRELAFAKTNNLYGVVITSVGPGIFNVAYFNTNGIVIDLGDYRRPIR